MWNKWWIGLSALALLLVAGVGALGPVRATGDTGPADVVAAFYDWYLDYIGDGEGMRNPLVDRAYRDSPYLSAALVAQVDALLDSFTHGGYDPFLQAQDIPHTIVVGEAVVTGDTARVPVSTNFAGHSLLVSLAQVDGSWQITAVESGS